MKRIKVEQEMFFAMLGCIDNMRILKRDLQDLQRTVKEINGDLKETQGAQDIKKNGFISRIARATKVAR